MPPVTELLKIVADPSRCQSSHLFAFITAANEVWGRVLFLHLFVSLVAVPGPLVQGTVFTPVCLCGRCAWSHVPSGVSVQKGSLSGGLCPGGLCPGASVWGSLSGEVSVWGLRGYLFREGVCPGGLCLGSLSKRSLSSGLCLGKYLVGGLCPGGLCPGASVWGSLSGEVSVWGLRGYLFREGVCPGGLCLGSLSKRSLSSGLCLGEYLSGEGLFPRACVQGHLYPRSLCVDVSVQMSPSGRPPSGQRPSCMVKSGPYTSYCNAALLQKLFGCAEEEALAGSSQNKWPMDPSGVQSYWPQWWRGSPGIQSKQSGNLRTQADGDGRVVVGRRYVTSSQNYAQVEVDELIFFNQALLENEVMELYNMY